MINARVLLLVALMATAGCLGIGGEEDAEPASATDTPDTNDTEAEETADTEPQNSTEWNTETYEGTITGTPFAAPTQASDGQSFEFTTPEGIDEVFVNVTTEGGDLRVLVAGAGCEFGNPCEEETQTDGGEGQDVNDSAEPGDWTVRFFPADTVAIQVDYTAEVAQGVVVPATR